MAGAGSRRPREVNGRRRSGSPLGGARGGGCLPSVPPGGASCRDEQHGCLPDIHLRSSGDRYEPVDAAVLREGISESRPLDFHTPYGCSKGAAEQYVLDYARNYGIPACVFRMSCIYGPHQFGTEDQGWVAHFLIRALERQPITLFGDGMQVRDLLFADDLVKLCILAVADPGCRQVAELA